jgi:sugar/nucleoside kinase (ribokinase family)
VENGFSLGSSRVAVNFKVGFGGSAANTAVALSRLGVPVGFLGAVGDDEVGELLIEDLEDEGVDISMVQRLRGRLSSRVYVVVDVETGERGMVGVRDAANHFELREKVVEYVAKARYLHISGYMLQDEPGRSTTMELIRRAEERGVEVSLDLTPEVSRREMVRGLEVCYLLCNEEEMRRLGYEPSERGALRAESGMGCRGVVVKLGREGCAASFEGRTYRSPGFQVEVVDTTGAGDAFNAGLLYGLLRGLDVKDTLRVANALGAYACMGPGARHLPTLGELMEMLRWRP